MYAHEMHAHEMHAYEAAGGPNKPACAKRVRIRKVHIRGTVVMGCTFNIFIPFSLALDQHPTTLSNLQRLNRVVVAEMNSQR